MSNTDRKTIHVISNTHWDRNWVYPFQETRLLLVEFMDNLLDLLETDEKFHSFLLDSQTIAVEDYLDLRPEKEDQIKKFVKEGKLIVGPWYDLPEEYIVNGESLVRNLVVGHTQAEKLGKISKIGYTPFSYGQTSQMPQIYQGFDIDTILFYRGINTKKSEFILEGPDGSRLLGCRFGAMSRFSYYFYVYRMARFGMGNDEWWYDWDRGTLPFRLNGDNHFNEHYYPLDVSQEEFNTDVLPEQLKKLVDDESEHFSTNHIACLQGFDCSSPDPQESELVEKSKAVLNEMGHDIKLDSMENFLTAMKKEVKDPEVLKGESRNPGAVGKWTHLMGDVISSHTKIKRRNAQVEVALQRYAEPFSTLGWFVGGEYMKSALDLSWKYLLQNHPHDDICSGGVDQMDKDMMYRFDQSEIISKGLTRRGLSAIQRQINNNDIDINETAITVFNPSPFSRTEVISFTLDLPDKSKYQGFSIRDTDGNAIPFVETGSESFGTLVRNLQDISLQLRSQRLSITAEFTDVPAFGYKTYLVKREDENISQQEVQVGGESKENVLENEFIKASINEDGSINVLDKKTGHEFKNQNYFEDNGESGHPWIHMEPETNETLTTIGNKAEIELVESSQFLIRYLVKHTLNIPVGLDGEEGNWSRSEKRIDMVIESIFTLRKDQRWIDVHTKLDNQAEQHRVRACFPTKLDAKFSAAEAAYDVIERFIVVPEESTYFGKPNPQYPMHRFVDMSDGKVGLGIFNDGIREYEAMVDDDRTVAITLFRAFTQRQTPVIGQWDVYPWMKLSQSLGLNEWKYAIVPHAGNWDEGNLYREVERFHLPIEMSQSGKGGGELPKEMSFVSVEPKEISLSTMKRAEKRDSLILRLFNPTEKEVVGKVNFHKDIKEAWLTNMNEERRDEIKFENNSIVVNFGAKKIVTIEIVSE